MAGFYSDSPEPSLRFGDVVTGFQTALPHIHKPGPDAEALDLRIIVTRPRFFVVMTPCCSIEDKSISLAPLSELRPAFFKNPFFQEEFTRINVVVPPEKSVGPEQLQRMPPDERDKLLAKPPGYAFYDCFIYAPHGLFLDYTLRMGKWSGSTRHRMVDFKSIFRVECDQIDRDKEAPSGTKVAQLTAAARKQFRDKLAVYFGRAAAEDLDEMGATIS